MIAPLRLGPRGDIALLVLRVLVGIAFIVHGWPKILHPASWLGAEIPHLPAWLGAVAAFVEVGGGIALVAGFATPIFAFLIAFDMVVAIFVVLVPHGAAFISATAGRRTYELPALYLASTIVFILIGPGAYSIDGARGGSGPRSGRRRR